MIPRHPMTGIAGLGALALAACATSEPEPPQDRARVDVPINAETEAPDLARLAAIDIPPGRCGMVLWTIASGGAAPIFRALDDGSGVMRIEGAERNLVALHRRGESRVGIPSEQVFEASMDDGRPVQVTTTLRWGTSFPGGAYVEGGTLRLTGADGWTRVQPVAGIVGCKVR